MLDLSSDSWREGLSSAVAEGCVADRGEIEEANERSKKTCQIDRLGSHSGRIPKGLFGGMVDEEKYSSKSEITKEFPVRGQNDSALVVCEQFHLIIISSVRISP